MRNRGDLLVAVALIGGFAVIAGVLGLVSLYLGVVSQALSGVQRTDPLPSYAGRPEAQRAPADQAVNYLVLATGPDGGLSSAFVAHLTRERDRLQLVGLPGDLLVEVPGSGRGTLADSYLRGPDVTVRVVEQLLATRMDHRIVVRLSGFLRLADVLGGITVENRRETAAQGHHWTRGPVTLGGAEAAVYVTSPTSAVSRLERTSAAVVEILRRVATGAVVINPARVEAATAVLNDCLVVDADLTAAAIRKTAMELRLRAADIHGLGLPLAGTSTLDGRDVTVHDSARLAALVTALAEDRLETYVADHPARWTEPPALPPR